MRGRRGEGGRVKTKGYEGQGTRKEEGGWFGGRQTLLVISFMI